MLRRLPNGATACKHADNSTAVGRTAHSPGQFPSNSLNCKVRRCRSSPSRAVMMPTPVPAPGLLCMISADRVPTEWGVRENVEWAFGVRVSTSAVG
jgi:uncharacterized membrane protein